MKPFLLKYPKGAFLIMLFSFLSLPCFSEAYTSNDYYKAGLTFYQQGDYAKAIQYFKAAVQLDPGNWQAYQVLGYAHYQAKDNATALEEMDKSLQLNPHNPALKSFDDNLRAKINAALSPVTSATAPPPGAEVSPPGTPTTAGIQPTSHGPEAFQTEKWVDFHLGYAYATLGDLQGAPVVFNKLYAGFNPSAKTDGIGPLVEIEGGIALNPENSICLAGTGAFFGGYTDSAYSGNVTQYDSYQPTMFSAQLEYYHFFPMGNSRFRIGGGFGLYQTSLNVISTLTSSYSISGVMTGTGLGGSLDFSWETVLSDQFTFNVYARGRFASTTNIQGASTDSYGNSQILGFAVDAQGYVGWVDTSNIGFNGIRWANVDYTGADGGIGISYHY